MLIVVQRCQKAVKTSCCLSRTHADCCSSMLLIRVPVSFRMQQSQSHHPTPVSSQPRDVLVRLQPVSELHHHPAQDLRQPCTHRRAEKRQVHSCCLSPFLLRTPPRPFIRLPSNSSLLSTYSSPPSSESLYLTLK